MSNEPHQAHIEQQAPMRRASLLEWLIGERLAFDWKVVAITVISLILIQWFVATFLILVAATAQTG